MSVRARGEHQQPFLHRWEPKRPGAPPREPGRSARRPVGNQSRAVAERDRVWGGRSRAALILAVVAIVSLAAATLATRFDSSVSSPSPYPATPRAWFDAYMAAAVDDPERVCGVLFTPAFADSYIHTPQRSCLSYFTHVADTQVQVQSIRTYRSTAVMRLRQRYAPRYYWGVVLARVDRGWRAVDLLSGH